MLRLATDASRKPTGEVSVRLLAPVEPSAWAVGASRGEGAPFEVAWHSERRPGAKAAPAELVAHVMAPEGLLFARAYGDDGSVSTEAVTVS